MTVKNNKPVDVSIVIPVYAKFDLNRALMSIQSAKLQEGVTKEIIIAEQNQAPFLRVFAEDQGLKYVYETHKPSLHHNDPLPGRVRNIGAKLATGDFLYMNDADILFKSNKYLYDLICIIEDNPRKALHRPPMRRIPIECFDEFSKRVEQVGLIQAISSLSYRQDFLATTDGIERKLKVVVRDKGGERKIFTTDWEDFERYMRDPSLKGQEPTIWSQNVHCGGTFMTRSQFEQVGGYCEDYARWGCEDSDLQWKLAQLFDLQRIPSEPSFEVLHIDHPRGYFSKEHWQANEAISARRRGLGIKDVISSDRRHYFGK